jgi:hypothetical protein
MQQKVLSIIHWQNSLGIMVEINVGQLTVSSAPPPDNDPSNLIYLFASTGEDLPQL